MVYPKLNSGIEKETLGKKKNNETWVSVGFS